MLRWLMLLSALVGSAGFGVAYAQGNATQQAGISIGSSAFTSTAPKQRQRPVDTGGHVTIIVLDMSGSMQDNDPQKLRCSAANTYIDLSGLGDYVGVVGLDNPSGQTDADHPFGATVDWKLTPREMATDDEKKSLRDAIAQQSNGCRPDGSTPTYDALSQAEAMLERFTSGKNIEGSVILLTDGDPEPNPDGQFNAITQNLVPKFQAHNWAIDSIALGPNEGNFHQLLESLSTATSGKPYDAGVGDAPGVSPFNITPFFVDIFQQRNKRSAGGNINRTIIDGSAIERQISIPRYTTNLDIVVTKDDPNIQVLLIAPDGEQFSTSAAGISVFVEDYFVIFSIVPQGVPVEEGDWTVAVTGTGTFSVKSLYLSEVTIDIRTPTAGQSIALGEAIPVSAAVSSNGAIQSPPMLLGTITYADAISAHAYSRNFDLTDPTGSGIYTNATLLAVPLTEPAGIYNIRVAIPLATTTLAPKDEIVRLANFPTAFLFAPGTTTITTNPINADVVGWNPVLRTIYSLPVLSFFSGLPLSGQPVTPSVELHGQVMVRDPQTGQYQPYDDATVTATYRLKGSATATMIQVSKDNKGAFHLSFPVASAGTYDLTLITKGTFQQTHGDLTHAQYRMVVALTSPTVGQQVRAWGVTLLLYPLILWLLYLVLRYPFVSKPFGRLEEEVRGGQTTSKQFKRARRSPLSKLVRPNRVKGTQIGVGRGMVFIFRQKGHLWTFPRKSHIIVKCSRGYQREGNPIRKPFSVRTSPGVVSSGEASYTIYTEERPSNLGDYLPF